MGQRGNNKLCAKWALLSLCLSATALIAASHPTGESSQSQETVEQLGRLSSNLMVDEQEKVITYEPIEPKGWVPWEHDGRMRHELPDEVFLDLRNTTKCFFPPRHQGQNCESGYAFAAITVAEWLFCMQTGHLVAFSEQYIMDCGKEYVKDLDGCKGGTADGAGTFLHNFGLELRSNYPFLDRDGKCPYNKEEALDTTGYIRTHMPDTDLIKPKDIPLALTKGPLIVAFNCDKSCQRYRGGVTGVTCFLAPLENIQPAVLVGHGRENGREYWLLRNSFGTGWGEDGYYKLDKSVEWGLCKNVARAYGAGSFYEREMHAYVNPDYKGHKLGTPGLDPAVLQSLKF